MLNNLYRRISFTPKNIFNPLAALLNNDPRLLEDH